ncbi:hypothetical protein OF001_U120089 [Pseudomonas sp. OF001]|nr:hypothetical protein OF001_U120089 [Pseudomonas sp. OF001]
MALGLPQGPQPRGRPVLRGVARHALRPAGRQRTLLHQ